MARMYVVFLFRIMLAHGSCAGKTCVGEVFADAPGNYWSGMDVCSTEQCPSAGAPYADLRNFGCSGDALFVGDDLCCDTRTCSATGMPTSITTTLPLSGACETVCVKNGASHSCRDRVEWLRGTQLQTLAEALQIVGSDCSNQCSCNVDDFPTEDVTSTTSTTSQDIPVPGCDGACSKDGQSHSCRNRIMWLQNHDSQSLMQALQTVGQECINQCLCTADDFELATTTPSTTISTPTGSGNCEYEYDVVFDEAALDDGVLHGGQRVLLKGMVKIPFLKIAAGTTLLFDPNSPVVLQAGCIVVDGELLVGSASCEHPGSATILLDAALAYKNRRATCWSPAELHVSSGGSVRMYGSKGKRLQDHTGMAWTSLLEPVDAGSQTLKLNADAASAGWSPGDQILVTTTDYDPRLSEVRAIQAVSGNEVTLSQSLNYYHHGSLPSSTFDVERAEVALLSRNLRIAATDPAVGGHTIAVNGFSSLVFSAVEFVDLGLEEVGRYPVHFHNAGLNHGEATVEFNSVRHSRFRCITIHSTANVRVTGNVCYDNRGHNVFFEDGAEHSVHLENNLVVGVQPIINRPPLNNIEELTADLAQGANFVSAYWFKNAANITVRGNVAAGGEGVAFMFAFCFEHKGLPGLAATDDLDTRSSQWEEFNGNLAHSYEIVLWNEALPQSADRSCKGNAPSQEQSPKLIVDSRSYIDWLELSNFGTFKVFGRGIWARATRVLWRGGFCSDSRNCIETLQSGTTPIRDCITTHVTFIGESANKGNTGNPHAPDGTYQRTLSDLSGSRVKPANSWGSVVNEGVHDYCFHDTCKGRQTTGAVLYDGPDLFAHCTFVGFRSTKYCAFSPRYSWDNNQHATATELFEPVLEEGTQLTDLVCVLPGPGFPLSTPDRLLLNLKITQDKQTSWLVRDHPFYTQDGHGTCTSIGTDDNPLAHCTGVRFALGMVGDDWVRNENGVELPLQRRDAAVPMKVGGQYTTSHPEATTLLAYGYEGQVHINGISFGVVPPNGLAYKLQFKDSDIPTDHACRVASTCNRFGTSGICVPSGGGYGLQSPLADHFDCVCFIGNCCESEKRCFTAHSGTSGLNRRLTIVI